MRVAIATENSQTDGAIYAGLLETLLGRRVDRFVAGSAEFSGWKSVYRLVAPYLQMALQAGVRHALLAIDNDGGARRHPEHLQSHVPPVGASIQELINSHGCRVCSLSAAVPEFWSKPDCLYCVAVPVQALETWILHVQGHPFSSPTPEQTYDRRSLKSLCYGKHAPHRVRVEFARRVLCRGDALPKLRQRPSFQRFETAVRAW